MDENTLVRWLRGSLPGGAAIGDDAAVLESEAWAVTVDQQIEGVHLPLDVDPAIAARRLLAVNLSDLAAMGAEPTVGFLALAAPDYYDHRRFFRAIAKDARHHDLRIAGGDLATQPTFSASLTLLGRRPDGRWLRRKGGQPGHHLWLGGTLGEAALGLQLLRRGAALEGSRVSLPGSFEDPRSLTQAARSAVRRQLLPSPQLGLGRWLSSCTSSGAAIDLSDGLARDLHRLCRASRVGAQIDVAALPTSKGGQALATALAMDLQSQQLFGGEDYVLLFSLPPEIQPPSEWKCHRIGALSENRKIQVRKGTMIETLPDRGWDHLDASKAPPRRSF